MLIASIVLIGAAGMWLAVAAARRCGPVTIDPHADRVSDAAADTATTLGRPADHLPAPTGFAWE